MGIDTLNKLKSFAGFIGIIISTIFTFKLCSEAIGFSTLDEKIITIVLSLALNIVEVVCFGFWYIRRDWVIARWACFILGVTVGLVSVSGSMGYFQVSIERNVLASEAYRLQKQQVEKWQSLADPKKNPSGYMWSARKAEEASQQLAAIKDSGAGIGNALYKLYSKVFDVDVFWVGFWFTLLLSVTLEAFFVFAFITGIHPDRKPAPTERTANIARNVSASAPAKESDKSPTGKPSGKPAGKHDRSADKEKAILALYNDPNYRYPDGTPKTQKIASHESVRTSRQYVSKILKRAQSSRKGGGR